MWEGTICLLDAYGLMHEYGNTLKKPNGLELLQSCMTHWGKEGCQAVALVGCLLLWALQVTINVRLVAEMK